MPLPPDEIGRRVAAARELRNVTQKKLNALFDEAGAGRTTAGRVERGTLELEDMHIAMLARVLNVPEWWFTEPDVDVLVGKKPPPALTPDETSAMLARLLAGHVQVTDQAGLGTQKPQGGEGRRPPS